MSHSTNQGTSIVEVIVSVGLFATVMVFGAGVLANMSKAHRQARSIRAVVENINLSLESMSREIRFGSSFYCGDSTSFGHAPADCSYPGKGVLTFVNYDGDKVAYQLTGANPVLTRLISTGSEYGIESVDVKLNSLTFFVTGSGSLSADTTQPFITIVLKGTAIQGAVPFVLQTSVVARLR